jgi:hypothetical protein
MLPDDRDKIVDEIVRLDGLITEAITRAARTTSESAFEQRFGEVEMLYEQRQTLRDRLDAESWPVHRVRPADTLS